MIAQRTERAADAFCPTSSDEARVLVRQIVGSDEKRKRRDDEDQPFRDGGGDSRHSVGLVTTRAASGKRPVRAEWSRLPGPTSWQEIYKTSPFGGGVPLAAGVGPLARNGGGASTLLSLCPAKERRGGWRGQFYCWASMVATSLLGRAAPAKLFPNPSFVMPFVTVMRWTPRRVGSRKQKKELAR